jgi:hypothetical protein
MRIFNRARHRVRIEMDETTTDTSQMTSYAPEPAAETRRFEDLPPAAQRALREAEERRAK